jgi:hypothetical protein
VLRIVTLRPNGARYGSFVCATIRQSECDDTVERDWCAGLSANAEDFRKVVRYSNLLKIGLVSRNPKNNDAIVDPQHALCVKSLQTEIEMMRPTVTVMLSGGEFNKSILFDLFGQDGWHGNANPVSDDRVGVKHHLSLGPVLWTDHPRVLRLQGGDVESNVLSFAAGYISAMVAKSA